MAWPYDLKLPDAGLARAEVFMRWLTGVIAASLHPGAAHARQQAALELLTVILDTWDVQASPCCIINLFHDDIWCGLVTGFGTRCTRSSGGPVGYAITAGARPGRGLVRQMATAAGYPRAAGRPMAPRFSWRPGAFSPQGSLAGRWCRRS